MGCPSCGSHKVQVTEPGAFTNTFFCGDCGHSYQKTSHVLKQAGLTLLTILLAAFILDGSDGGLFDGWGGRGS